VFGRTLQGRCLAQAGRAKAILARGIRYRQPVRLGRAPAIAIEPAFEWRAATRTSEFSWAGCSFWLHGSISAVAWCAAVTLENRISPNAMPMLLTISFALPIDLIGATGAVLTTLCWLLQAIKVIREKETRALSLPATAAFTIGVVLWLIYGVAIGDWPLIGSNAVTLALMAVILTMKLRYG
jgi:MtN3 and saliva related transmembrane protein